MLIELAEEKIYNWRGATTGVKLVAVITEPMTTSDGIHIEPADRHEIACTVANEADPGGATVPTLTIPAWHIHSTYDALNNPRARWNFYFANTNNTKIRDFVQLQDISINQGIMSAANPVTYTQLIQYNRTNPFPSRIVDSSYTKAEILSLLDNLELGIAGESTRAALAGLSRNTSLVTDDVRGFFYRNATSNKWISANGERVNVNEYPTFAAAIADIGSTQRTLIIPDEQAVSVTVAIPSTLTLEFTGSGKLNIAVGVVVTIAADVVAPLRQIFTGSGTVIFSGKVWRVYPQWWNAAVDGTTDDYTAVQAAINSLGNGNGGNVHFTQGTWRINTALTFINDAATPPRQKPIILTGSGGFFDGAWTGSPNGGTVLDLRATTTPGKIDTRGGGLLEIRDIVLKDGGTSTNAFIQTTNTIIILNKVAFVGSGAGGTASANDAIVFGGTTTDLDGDADAAYQGYGSIIENCYFSKIKRVVYARTFTNALVVRNNTVSTTCGSSTLASIDIDGNSAGGAGANGVIIKDNLIEVPNYKYGIRLNYSTQSIIEGNGYYDETGTTTAFIRLEANAQFNLIIHGFHNDAFEDVSDASGGSNTIITSHQSQLSLFPQPIDFTNTNVSFRSTSSTGPYVFSFAAPTSKWYDQVTGGTGSIKSVNVVISGGSAEEVAQWQRGSATDKRLLLSGSTNNILLAAADLRVWAANGTTLFLGTSVDQSIRITAGVLVSTKATGTAPFTVASTTKVDNLNADKLDGNDWAAPAAIGTGTPAAGTFTTLTGDGSALTALNASALATGTVPLTRLVGITNTEIAAGAAIAYSKLNLAGAILNADIHATAAIAVNKLAAVTASRALVSDGSGFVSPATTTATEIGYVNGVTSAIQTQLNDKASLSVDNTFADGVDFAFNATTGSKIGTATTQKIGFWNATPVVQGALIADATDAATAITQLNLVLARLRTYGLIAT